MTNTNLESMPVLSEQSPASDETSIEPRHSRVLIGYLAGLKQHVQLPGWRRSLRTTSVISLDYLSIALPLGLLVNSAAVGVGGTLAAPSYVFLFSLITTACFIATGLYRQNWRFVSLADCSTLLLTVSSALCVAWVITLGIPELRRLGMALVPLAFTHFCIATTFMLGMRMLRRSAREFRLRWIGDPASSEECTSRRLILIGEPEWAVSVIQLTHANKSMHRNTPTTVMGVLLTRPEETITGLCGVPVLGSHTQLARSLELLSGKGQSPDSVVVCDDGVNLSEKDLLQVMRQVRELGLELVRIDDPWTKLLARQSAVDFDSLPITDLLGRSEINLTGDAVSRQVCGQSVLVTGAGGTIGGELVRQLAAFRPSRLVLVDHCEFNLYSVEMLLREAHPELVIVPELCNIRDASEVRHVFARHNPVIVYHAAALKHVPMVEANPCGGAHTNILGTKNIADAVCEFGVRAMVQVSTDKAVNPIGLMGATKRVGELYCQSLDFCGTDDPDSPRFMTVRFGNVLGSSGSVVPLFKRQLLEGRPLTITHPDIERFFMSVGEAVHLILQSSSHALEENATRGSIFVLDMGAPVKIIDLARRMIRLFGLEPDVDVPIQVVGLRPGEKLYEELFDSCEEEVQSGIVGLHEARSRPIPLPLITRAIDQLATAVRDSNQADVLQITHTLVKLPSSGVDMTSLYEKSPNTWRVSGPKLVAEA